MTAPVESHARKRRLIVLGAGFTAPLGMPVTAELLAKAYAIAEQRPWRRRQCGSAHMGDWLLDVLDWYYPLAGIDREVLRSGQLPADLRLEEFLSFVSARATMGYESPVDVDAAGTRFVDCMRAWLGEAVATQQAQALQHVPHHYLEFARAARDAVVISFNWNTVLEHLWQTEGVAYALRAGGGEGESRASLLKVHGSIDWFALEPGPVPLEPLGPDLPNVGRAPDIAQAYRAGLRPCLVMPTFDKALQLQPLEHLWQAPWSGFDGLGEVVIIGYSVRPDDFHSRAVLYPQLVRLSRKGLLTVKVVDRAETPAQRDEVRARYAGVEPCLFHFGGFTQDTLDFIFA
jgi:hypothetical protein